MLDAFAAEVAWDCRWARRHNDGHPLPAWSECERLAVALALEDDATLTEMGYTVREAARRVWDGMASPPIDMGAWLNSIRAEIKEA